MHGTGVDVHRTGRRAHGDIFDDRAKLGRQGRARCAGLATWHLETVGAWLFATKSMLPRGCGFADMSGSIYTAAGSASAYLIFPVMDAMPREIVPARARVFLYAVLSMYMVPCHTDHSWREMFCVRAI